MEPIPHQMPRTLESTARGRRYVIEVAGADLVFREVDIDDLTPTGRQLANAAGSKPPDDAIVLRMLADGELDLIRPDEVVDLRHNDGRFVIVQGDHIDLLRIDGNRYEWPCRVVSGRVLRRLGHVSDDKAVFLQRADGPDLLISDHDLLNLDAPGIEAFVTRKVVWRLNVQGVVIEVATSKIEVGVALEKAGFDPTKPWHVFLKVAGQPKREVSVTDIIDLDVPGIEKLRLLPRNVDNGEVPPAPRRNFDLLEVDEAYLERLRLEWETVEEHDGRRWLLIHDFPVPSGYTVSTTLLALEIPTSYPGAQIYGFYAHPALALASGRAIPNTQLSGVVLGKHFVGWSRYRPGQPWDPANDNVVTQICLVEAALAKEVGE